MWHFDRLDFLTREEVGLRTPVAGDTRKVRLNLPSTHVPLFHVWKP